MAKQNFEGAQWRHPARTTGILQSYCSWGKIAIFFVLFRKNPAQQKVWWYECNFQDEEFSSEPSVQNVDFIKDIKEIKTRKVWLLQIYQSHLKIYFPAFKEHKTANHGKDWGIQHPYPQCQQKKEKIHQGKFIYCCLIPNAWQIYFKGNIQVWKFLVFSSQNDTQHFLRKTNKWHWTNSTFWRTCSQRWWTWDGDTRCFPSQPGW